MDRNKAIGFMHDLLRMMVSKDGSDLFITSGSPPAMKIDGKVATVYSRKTRSVIFQFH
jgi:twitching motility protein PilU